MNTLRLKVVLVGESGVGKSSTIRRFVMDEFSDNYIITMGAKVSKKELYIPGSEPFRVLLTIWDIMGAYTLRDLLQDSYFNGANGVLAVFDRSQPETLRYLEGWMNTVRRVVGNVPWVVVGNKADLVPGDISARDLQFTRTVLQAPTILNASAKTGQNVEVAFQELAKVMARNVHPSQPA